MHTTTTSIRLTPQLTKKLERASHALHQGKNWIIKQALEEYLQKLEYGKLAEEARRQSLLVSQAEKGKSKDNEWEDNSDTSGWS